MATPKTTSYVPALDAIRGLAIVLVLGLHYGPVGFGWIGVQLFFVLSGFLITGILLAEREKPLGDYVKRFYIRRALRIFPLYFAFLIVCSLVYLATGYLKSISVYWPYLYTYIFNIRALFGITKIDEIQNDVFFHLWSLSIEEQFYLFWPWLVYALSLNKFRKCLLAIIFLAPIFRWLTQVWCFSNGHDLEFTRVFIYYFTPCQVDSFAWGAMLAAFPRPTARASRAAFWLLFGLVAIAGYLNHSLLAGQHSDDDFLALGYPLHMFANLQYIWGYTLLNIFGASLIAYFLTRPEPKPSPGWKALLRMGKVSYGMYILHAVCLIPFRLWIAPDVSPLAFVALLIPFIFLVWLLAELSYRYLEKPFLDLKSKLAE